MEHHFTKSRPLNSRGSCPTGYHKRSAYTSSAGHSVPPRCVRSTTVYKNTSKQFKAKTSGRMTRRIARLVPSIRSLARKVCPPGQIERKGYVRKFSTAVRAIGYTRKTKSGKIVQVKPSAKSTVVESRCVKNTGKPGKGVPKPIGPLRKGELKKHGYSFRAGEDTRHTALRHAIADYGALGVFRKLDAVAKLTERTIPEAAKVYEKDRNWVRSKFSIKAF